MKHRFLFLQCTAWLLAMMLLSPALAQDVPELIAPVTVHADTFAARREGLTKTALYHAAVVPYMETLAFPREGVISQFHVVLGQEVKAGDALVTLVHEDEEKQLSSLMDEMAGIEEDAHYAQELYAIDMAILEAELRMLQRQHVPDEKAMALKRLDMEERQLNAALEAELRAMKLLQLGKKAAALEEKLSQHTLYAPFDGRVAHLAEITNGSYAASGTPLVFLADDARLSIRCAFIPGAELAAAHDMYALIGEKRYAIDPVNLDPNQYVAPISNGESASTAFSIRQMDDGIACGQYAAVCVALRHVDDALVIPANALYTEGLTRYVYVDEEGQRVRRVVETGLTNDVMTEITQGLKEGEVVYVKE